jgi:DNA-binding GntR family transcriptional regulator
MPSQTEIAQQVVESILAQKLADLFGVSRTLVREALMQLQARGFVEVRTRKGWYVVEPSVAQARDAFGARRAVESGLLQQASVQGMPLQAALRRLRRHVADERDAIAAADPATRAFLLADFHVCLADCLGNPLLAELLRDLTARTTLAATLYQSTHDAQASNAQHAEIVAAIARGDLGEAARLMLAHIGDVEAALDPQAEAVPDAREKLRATLAPLGRVPS